MKVSELLAILNNIDPKYLDVEIVIDNSGFEYGPSSILAIREYAGSVMISDEMFLDEGTETIYKKSQHWRKT